MKLSGKMKKHLMGHNRFMFLPEGEYDSQKATTILVDKKNVIDVEDEIKKGESLGKNWFRAEIAIMAILKKKSKAEMDVEEAAAEEVEAKAKEDDDIEADAAEAEADADGTEAEENG